MNDNSSLHRRFRSLLPKTAAEKALWLGLIAPLALLVASLKVWRIAERGEIPVWWAAPDLLRSDLLVVFAVAATGTAAFRGLSHRIDDRVILGLNQIAVAALASIEVVANHFFSVTGSTFDFHLLWFSVDRFDETFSVIRSEVSPGAWLLLGTVITLFLILPWVVYRRSDDGDTPCKIPRRRHGLLWSSGLAVGCLIFAALPPLAEDYTAFGRATVVNMALSLQNIQWSENIADDLERTSTEHLELQDRDPATDNRRNVAIIILESTRAESTTIHNSALETTPFLDDLADRSTVAKRAYTPMPHTSKALVATLCGIEPRLRMPITEARADGLPARCLAELLGDEGYESVFFQSATERFEDRPQLVENMGYDDFFPLERMDASKMEEANYFGVEDAVMLPYSRQWLKNRGDGPVLTTYLTLTPHHDYLAPKQRYGRFDFVDDDEELNRYKNTLYYVDQFSRELLEQYRNHDIYDDTLFVIIGDHGEAFGEHGRTQHDNVIWEEGLHVPFLIYDPQAPEHRRIDAPTSQLDVVPTVLDRLGYETNRGQLPGMPVEESDDDRVLFAHCWYERRCMARIAQRYKYIDHFGQRGPEVYDLLDDPGEQNNLADEMRDASRSWRAEVYGWRQTVNDMYRRAHSDVVDEYLHEELPDGIQRQEFQIGDFARHLGFELDTDELRRGQRVTITHYFEVLDDIPPGWNLFVHGVSGSEMMNLDHVPVDGMHPLQDWEPETIVADSHSFRIPRNWEPGPFRLLLGIYHEEQGRAPIDGDSDDHRRAIVIDEDVP